jgi:hypothetical protein
MPVQLDMLQATRHRYYVRLSGFGIDVAATGRAAPAEVLSWRLQFTYRLIQRGNVHARSGPSPAFARE